MAEDFDLLAPFVLSGAGCGFQLPVGAFYLSITFLLVLLLLI